MDNKKNPLNQLRKTADRVGKDEAAYFEFWMAPEILKSDYTLMPTMQTDIYSYSIILQEIFTRKDPYAEHYDNLSYSELIKAIVDNNLRPTHTQDMPNAIKQIMDYGWSENPINRPSCEQIQKDLRRAHHFKKTVLDTMMETMDEYTNTLEESVAKKTRKLEAADEKIKYIEDKLVPPSWQKRVKQLSYSAEGSQEFASVSILCLKLLKLNGAQRNDNINSDLNQISNESDNGAYVEDASHSSENRTTFVEKMHYADKKLHELCKKYKAFRLDYCDTFMILCGLGSTSAEQKHVLNACKIATDILTSDLTKENELQWQGVLHQGSIHAGLINNGLPRCYIVGDPIDKAMELLKHSEQNKVLVSMEFSARFKGVEQSTFHLSFNRNLFMQVNIYN